MNILPNDIIEQYKRKGGPLPKWPPGTVIGCRFWTFYMNPATPRNMLGVPTSLTRKAGLAALARVKAEPGIDPKTDPRARREPQGPGTGSHTTRHEHRGFPQS